MKLIEFLIKDLLEQMVVVIKKARELVCTYVKNFVYDLIMKLRFFLMKKQQ